MQLINGCKTIQRNTIQYDICINNVGNIQTIVCNIFHECAKRYHLHTLYKHLKCTLWLSTASFTRNICKGSKINFLNPAVVVCMWHNSNIYFLWKQNSPTIRGQSSITVLSSGEAGRMELLLRIISRKLRND